MPVSGSVNGKERKRVWKHSWNLTLLQVQNYRLSLVVASKSDSWSAASFHASGHSHSDRHQYKLSLFSSQVLHRLINGLVYLHLKKSGV